MKPDLQELYRQKEQARIEKMAEIDEAGKIIRRALDALNQAIVEHKDISTIAQVARDCLSELRRLLKARDFKSLTKFDLDRMLRNRLEMIKPKNNLKFFTKTPSVFDAKMVNSQ